MSVPRALRIGPYTWQVRCSKKRWKKHGAADEVGNCDLANHVINVKPDQEIQYERATLFHEIMHAARYSSGAKVDLNDPEESIIQAIDGSMVAVLQDNPDLLDYLGLT